MKKQTIIVEKRLNIPPDYQFKAINSNNFIQANWHKNKFTIINKYFKFNKKMRVLDIGTGSGNLELAFAKHVESITGIDYNDEAIDFLRKQLILRKIRNVKLIQEDVRNIQKLINIGKFDTIFMVDVLEHVSINEAKKLAGRLKKFLKPGGKVCVITPNCKSTWLLLEKILDKFTIVPKFEGEQHLAKFCEKNLKEIFTDKGFRVEKISTFNLFSYLVPYYPICKKVCLAEIYLPLNVGNMIVAIFSYDPQFEKITLRKWKKYYSKNQEELSGNSFIKIIFDLGHKYIASRGKDVNGKILDVGSGIGYHLKFEKIDERRTYICFDPDKSMLDKITQRGIIKIQAKCEEIPIKSKTINLIIASHILEHVRDLPKCIKELKRVLKDDGILLVVLPCHPGVAWNLITKISPSRKRLGKIGIDYDIVMKNEHVNSFKRCVEELTKEFTIEEEKYYPLLIKNHNVNFISCFKLIKKNR